MAMATANRIELFNAAPVDMSNDAFSSAPLGEDPATSGVQRLVVALVPDGVGEPDAMAKSIHVLTMVLHDEHVGCTIVGVFVFVPVAVLVPAGEGEVVVLALHTVPSSVVPVPQVIAGATQDVLPTEDAVPEGHATQLLFLPFSVAKVEDGHNLHWTAPTISLNSPGLHGKHEP